MYGVYALNMNFSSISFEMLFHILALTAFAVCTTAFLKAPRGVLPPIVMLPREPDQCCLQIEFHIRRHENNVMRDKRGDDLIAEHSHMALNKKVLKVAKVWILWNKL